MITTRTRQIHAAALVTLQGIEIDPTGEGVDQYLAAAQARGWTLETSAPLGHIIRHEGVVFTSSELARIKADALRLLS